MGKLEEEPHLADLPHTAKYNVIYQRMDHANPPQDKIAVHVGINCVRFDVSVSCFRNSVSE